MLYWFPLIQAVVILIEMLMDLPFVQFNNVEPPLPMEFTVRPVTELT
jgi:hypothetical protein